MKINLCSFILPLALLLFFYIGWYCHSHPLTKKETTQSVDAIFMHEPNRYSFMIEDEETKKVSHQSFSVYTTLIQDVKEGDKCWYLAKWESTRWYDKPACYSGRDYFECYELEIHIHSMNDIGTAGWNHGKFGSGQTERLE